jgi:hypothetical protein
MKLGGKAQRSAEPSVSASQPCEAPAERRSARSVEPAAKARPTSHARDPRLLAPGKLFGVQCSLLGRIRHLADAR